MVPFTGLRVGFSVWGMNEFAVHVGATSHTIDALAHFDAGVLRDAGANPNRITAWGKAHTAYYGPTRYTRQQRNAIRIARQTGKSLDQLVFIEQQLTPIKSENDTWRLRLALLSVPGNYTTLRRTAAEILPDPDADTPPPQPSVRFTSTRKGTRSVTATGNEHDIAALEYALRRKLDPHRPAGPQMYEALTGMLRAPTNTHTNTHTKGDSNRDGTTDSNRGGDGDGTHSGTHSGTGGTGGAGAGANNAHGCGYGGDSVGGGVYPAVPRPLIVIPLADHTRIINGDGDDTILGLSDGTTITGAEYLATYHGEELEVAVFHPQAGPVNMYTTTRFATTKQRDLARATLTTCPVPGCRHAADNCEVHHVNAWSRGGQTNMDNLAVLCRYHNRTNDDDPHHNNRGRIRIRNGTPEWVSPRGRPAPNTTHQYGAMHLLFGR